MSRRFCFLVALMCATAQSMAGSCFDNAGLRHGVAPALLLAIAQQESALNPKAINRNRDGSWDIGVMQINSRWLPVLARHGILAESLWDPCTNIDVGAWILASNFRRYGLNWNGLGAYNASNPYLRVDYAKKIINRLKFSLRPINPSTCSGSSTSHPEQFC